MTTSSFTGTYDMNTTASVRALGALINARMTAVGLVQTADTGQVNWATVTAGTNSSKGYEIWRFDDDLQATAPIFFRLDWEQSGTHYLYPVVTIGKASNGAGFITTDSRSMYQTISGSSVTGSPSADRDYHFVGHEDTGFFGMQLHGTANSGTPYGGSGRYQFSICRTADAAGNPTGGGYVFTDSFGPTSQAGAIRVVSFDTTSQHDATINNLCALPPTTSTAVGTLVQMARAYCYIPTLRTLPGLYGYLENDLTWGSTFTMAPYGSTTRTYKAMGRQSSTTGQPSFAWIWE